MPRKRRKVAENLLLDDLSFKSLIDQEGDLPLWKALVFGQRCWGCFSGSAEYTCEKCHRSFHKVCAFIKGYPLPRFNLPVKELACTENGKLVLLECSECLAAVNTVGSSTPDLRCTLALVTLLEESWCKLCREISTLKYFPLDKLNWTFFSFIQYLAMPNGLDYQNLLNQGFQGRRQKMTLKMIQEKAKKKEYNTIEGLLGDLKSILYEAVQYQGEQSELVVLTKTMISVTEKELCYMKACPDCYSRRWDESGELKPKKELTSELLELCQDPHIVVWARFTVNPMWPAKLIKLKPDEGDVVVQCFQDGGCYRQIPKTSVLVYGQNMPPRPTNERGRKALAELKLYLSKSETKFGTAHLPRLTEPLGEQTSILKLRKTIYPNHEPRKSGIVPSVKKLLIELGRVTESTTSNNPGSSGSSLRNLT